VRWSRAEQLLVLLAAGAVIAGVAALVVVQRSSPSVRVFEAPATAEIVVQVDGAVLRPGLYRLPAGARADEAIRAAGGSSPAADVEALNLARLLRDGERLTVPYRASAPAESFAPPPRRAASGPPRVVDLNRAAAPDLEALPGIGPVLARRIIAYRDRHGPFHRVEDLLQVEGIGPKLLARLRQHVVIR